MCTRSGCQKLTLKTERKDGYRKSDDVCYPTCYGNNIFYVFYTLQGDMAMRFRPPPRRPVTRGSGPETNSTGSAWASFISIIVVKVFLFLFLCAWIQFAIMSLPSLIDGMSWIMLSTLNFWLNVVLVVVLMFLVPHAL